MRISNKLEEWLTFIINDDMEKIKMIDNEYVQKAEDELEYINSDGCYFLSNYDIRFSLTFR